MFRRIPDEITYQELELRRAAERARTEGGWRRPRGSARLLAAALRTSAATLSAAAVRLEGPAPCSGAGPSAHLA
jgi:hypothetical protein